MEAALEEEWARGSLLSSEAEWEEGPELRARDHEEHDGTNTKDGADASLNSVGAFAEQIDKRSLISPATQAAATGVEARTRAGGLLSRFSVRGVVDAGGV